MGKHARGPLPGRLQAVTHGQVAEGGVHIGMVLADQVAVDVESLGHGRVPQVARDADHIDPLLDEPRGVVVPEVMGSRLPSQARGMNGLPPSVAECPIQQEIAAELGYTHRSAARKAVVGALQARTADAVDQLRDMEVQRLDSLQAAVWADALAGDIKAVDAVLRIVQARVKLLGLDQSDDKEASAHRRLVSAAWKG